MGTNAELWVIIYALFLIALYFYVALIRAVGQLVAESRKLNTGARFNRLWWHPAWRLHRENYPTSGARKQIVTRFALAFAFISLATACMGIIAYKR
jgi:hypothetical protein